VTEFLSEADTNQAFNSEFTRFLRKKTNTQYRHEESYNDKLPAHLKVNYVLLDADGLSLAEGRELIQLQLNYRELVTEVIEEIHFEIEKDDLQYWPDIDLPLEIEKPWQGQRVIGYPALIDRQSHVEIKVLDDFTEASELHVKGVKRLLMIQLKDKIKMISKSPPRFEKIALLLQGHIDPDTLKKNFLDVIMDELICLNIQPPRTLGEFESLVAMSKKIISELIERLSLAMLNIAESYHALSKVMSKYQFFSKGLIADCHDQLDTLLPPYEKPLFLFQHIAQIPRYLKAISIRLEKYPQRKIKDDELVKEIHRLQNKWIEKVTQMVEKGKAIPDDFIAFQWSIQELRVSLFAEELKTPYPISIKRMDTQWNKLVN